jgi:hypothetical protein
MDDIYKFYKLCISGNCLNTKNSILLLLQELDNI